MIEALRRVNQELRDKSFNNKHQYSDSVYQYDIYFRLFQIVKAGVEFDLCYLDSNKNLVPVFRGSMKRCREIFLSRISQAHVCIEMEAHRRGHVFCYLPEYQNPKSGHSTSRLFYDCD